LDAHVHFDVYNGKALNHAHMSFDLHDDFIIHHGKHFSHEFLRNRGNVDYGF